MTSGSFSINTPALIATKNWGGTDGRTAENSYNSDILRQETEPWQKWERSGGVWSYTPGFDSYYAVGIGLIAPAAYPNQLLKCQTELISRIRGHDFNAGIFLAELPQSLATVGNTTGAVLGALANTLRGDYKNALRCLGRLPGQSVGTNPFIHRPNPIFGPKGKFHGLPETKVTRNSVLDFKSRVTSGDISGAWLSLRYGWSPLINDVFEMMRAIEAQNRHRRTTFRCAVSQKGTHNCSADPVNYTIICDDIVTIKKKAVISETLSQARLLGLNNPLSILWEKTPWSFVVDWFVPIGSYLDSLGFFAGTGIYVTTSTFAKSEVDAKGPYYIGANLRWQSGRIKSKRIVFNRNHGPSTSLPKLSLNQLNKCFSLGHIQNAAALIHQRVGFFSRFR